MAQKKTMFGSTLLAAITAMLGGCGSPTEQNPYPWMSNDVPAAWNSGYKGQGTTITVVDEYTGETFAGTLGSASELRTHGGWTSQEAQLVAPSANVQRIDYNTNNNTGYGLASGLNVISNSYSYRGTAAAGYANLPLLERTTVDHARNGTAVVVKSAGNDSRAFDGTSASGIKDVLGTSLIGTESAIIVGALSTNGSAETKASMADYSNYAGNNAQVQSQFLVVGVDAGKTGLSGTSFAVPIVSGYAAILGSKFTTATPSQVKRQLLNTARTDTIQGYNPAIHGKGEASLSRALAPAALQ